LHAVVAVVFEAVVYPVATSMSTPLLSHGLQLVFGMLTCRCWYAHRAHSVGSQASVSYETLSSRPGRRRRSVQLQDIDDSRDGTRWDGLARVSTREEDLAPAIYGQYAELGRRNRTRTHLSNAIVWVFLPAAVPGWWWCSAASRSCWWRWCSAPVALLLRVSGCALPSC